jgi:hypothetical protein
MTRNQVVQKPFKNKEKSILCPASSLLNEPLSSTIKADAKVKYPFSLLVFYVYALGGK